MPRPFDGSGNGPLVLCAPPRLAARLDAAAIRHEPPQEVEVLVVRTGDLILAEPTDPPPKAATATWTRIVLRLKRPALRALGPVLCRFYQRFVPTGYLFVLRLHACLLLERRLFRLKLLLRPRRPSVFRQRPAARPIQEEDPGGDHPGAGALLALRCVPGPRAKAALHIHPTALLQVLTALFR